ncbi:GntR family transcriptional regulator [Paracidovorax citrulli]
MLPLTPTRASSAPSPSSVPRRSVADQVYEGLKRDIGQFRLVPGDRFSELELCARLGVSRTPVRQALVRLQQEGYVEVLFRSGWRVLPFDFDKYEQLYDLRMVLETAAAHRLCGDAPGTGQMKPALLQGLAAIWLVAPAARSTDGTQVRQWDEEFHCTLVEAAGNAEMARVHRDITERIRVIRSLDFTKSFRIEATYDEHAQILRAILAGRSDQATMLLRAHIGSSQAEVRKITLHELHMARQELRERESAA